MQARLECSRWDPFHDHFFWSKEEYEGFFHNSECSGVLSMED